MKNIFIFIGQLLHYIFPYFCYKSFKGIYKYIYTGYFKKAFKSFGKDSVINPSFLMLVGAQNISIGQNVYIGSRVQLTAWNKVNNISYHPTINIGNNTSIGDESQITCINIITIGNGVLTGKKILITDNSHGLLDNENLNTIPIKRKMYSKGPVIIQDNVWIGEKATILPGVTIGEGAIIGANSVVTKDVPAKSLVVGCPAKIVKTLKF